jgi:hypothetical protein
VIVEPLSAGTLKGSDSGGMMADGLYLRAESSLVFQVAFSGLNAVAMRSCGNSVEYALTRGVS